METRIGLVLPSPNIHMEPQFNALGLGGVTFRAAVYLDDVLLED